MKIVKYGKAFPAISDFDIPAQLEAFCADTDVIETSSFLVIDGVRASIYKGDLAYNKVKIHLVDTDETISFDSEGRFKQNPVPIFGADLLDDYLSTLIGLNG